MRRRDFCTGIAGVAAAAWPVFSHAQQKPMPVVGFLHAGRQAATARYLAVFRRTLAEAGFVEGQNVAIEARWADDHYDRLPSLANELVARRVDVIATVGARNTGQAARQATSTIPIVFGTGGDPVASGFATSMARPDGNLTGVNYVVSDLGPKRLDLIAQMVPQSRLMAALMNPQSTATEEAAREMQAAAQRQGLQLLVVTATSEREVDEAFAAAAERRAGGLVVQADPFIHSRRGQLIALAARHRLPTIYTWREFAEEGGLITYGPSLAAVYRQIAVYVARILRGAKPGDLPIVRPDTFDLVVNLKTAKALGLTLPPTILALADEIID
jgi:putative ABC transport system substrate-binding protein